MSKSNGLLLACLTGLVFAAGAAPSAEWLVEGTPIPAQRLIQNLETRLRSDRRNADLLTNLARLHSYTYATKSDTARQTHDGLFYQEPTTYLPTAISDALNAEMRKQATRHLEWAIERYRQALAINTSHHVARLGLAWCLEQYGKKADAIAEYRRAFESAWPVEEKLPESRLKPFVTVEAGRRLLVLLGPGATSADVAWIHAKIGATAPISHRSITPIAVPLDPVWSPFARSTHRAIAATAG